MNNDVYIIGSGTSLENFNFKKLKDKDTIVVNKAIFYVPNPTYFITMDYIFYTDRLRQSHQKTQFENIKGSKFFVINMANDSIVESKGQIKDVRWGMVYELNQYNVIIKSYKTSGIGFEFNDFRNGNNSGHCALQLAVLLGYKNIHLLGMDFNFTTTKTHFHRGYNQGKNAFNMKLGKYYHHFYGAILHLKNNRSDIKLYNYSKISYLYKLLPYISLEEL